MAEPAPAVHHPVARWRAASAVLSWAAFALAILAAAWGNTLSAVFLWPALAAFGFAFAGMIRLPLIDLVAEFSYRERFGIFLLHLLAFVAPRLFLGLHGFAHALGSLGALIAFHAVLPQHFGRLLAVSGALILVGYGHEPLPPDWIGLVWVTVALFSVRALHVRSTLEGEREETGPDMRYEWPQVRDAVLLPLAIGVTTWAIGRTFLQPRTLVFTGLGVQPQARPLGPVAHSDVFFDGIILIVLVVALLAVAKWLQGLLGKLRGGTGEPEMVAAGKVKTLEDAAASDDPLATEDAAGPRRRILAAFQRFAGALAAGGVPRTTSETAAAYTIRVAKARERAELADAKSATFDRACYSPEDLTEEDAAGYEAFLDEEVLAVQAKTESAQGGAEVSSPPRNDTHRE